MDYKKKYKQFKQWQRDGKDFVVEDPELNECKCCNHLYRGNYCPKCGQNKRIDSLSWESVRVETMNVWGLGNRSMPYSLWQILLRPGYFISDYINGKRQVSFPPVKMLVIMGFFASLLQYLFETPSVIPIPDQNSELYFLKAFIEWCDANEGWTMLIMCSFLILPTWILFRNSPRNTRHNLPEGFFIQTFMAILMVVISIVDVLIGALSWFVGIYFYYTAYRQLFGYSVWGTVWRMIFCVAVAAFTLLQSAIFTFLLNLKLRGNDSFSYYHVFAVILVCLGVDAVLLLIGYFIDSRGNNVDKHPDSEEKPVEKDAAGE